MKSKQLVSPFYFRQHINFILLFLPYHPLSLSFHLPLSFIIHTESKSDFPFTCFHNRNTEIFRWTRTVWSKFSKRRHFTQVNSNLKLLKLLFIGQNTSILLNEGSNGSGPSEYFRFPLSIIGWRFIMVKVTLSWTLNIKSQRTGSVAWILIFSSVKR